MHIFFCFRSLTVPAMFPRNLLQSGSWPVMLLSLTPPSSRCLIFKSWAGILLRLLLLGRRSHDHRGPPCLRHLRFSQHCSKVWGKEREGGVPQKSADWNILHPCWHRFDPIRMLPRGNYLSEWIHTQNQYWPSYGLQVQVSFFDENDLLPSSWLCNILLIICRWWRDP